MSATYETVDFTTYTYRLLKKIYPDMGISANASSTMNNLVRFIIKKVVDNVNRLMLHSKGRKTITSRDIQSAVTLACGDNMLLKRGIGAGSKAVTTYHSGEIRKEAGKKSTKSKKSNLIFPVTRTQHIMMELAISERKSVGASVYLTAFVEYIMGEVIELVGNRIRDLKKIRIQTRYIKEVIDNDPQLSEFFKGVIISNAVY